MKKQQGKIGLFLLLVVLISLSGCTKTTIQSDGSPQIYYFDTTKGELFSQPLGAAFLSLGTDQEKVEYIINELAMNKNIQGNTLVAINPMPIIGVTTNINDRMVQIKFSNDYNNLATQERIGIRAAIVYSLTQLDFIDSVDFYIEDSPLTTSTGKVIGPISQANIKLNVLEPNPATTPYTLPLYFVNAEGKLVKEERGVRVSDPTSVEKLLIEELIKGPNSEGLSASLPSDMKVNDATTTNGVCQIDLSFDLKSKFFTSPEVKERMIYAIVNSLTEIPKLRTDIPKIKKVAFLVDGKSDIEFTKEIDLRDTFERNEAYIGE
ncbi:GerMN domain-containing protein [Cellulosilyticum lentocellum]|uniref:Lipoprotein LpqB, GerMN domain n=1 Tax=Cellulosilyticum lentocellum (strain ATCC 49066 / DSM 5427 / NCIMB 11756 / RHM5) TaxID=642492 RepID=F2JQX5_CELLD|nr:GerMN domain-containing protein [Cellulosilyticum lentocellum]ADZ83833.1 Lipoprotein LpqB, GerMN domain [Cellulosilyticum lentocellum DSM 5427]